MSNHQTSKDLHNVTSSPELEDGVEPYNSQDGVQTDLFGQEVLPVNPSQQQGKEKEKMTSDISGLCSLISSESANLQQSLENRLQRLSDMGGSMIYKLTLRKKDTPQGRSYFQLAASAPRIKENGSSSWPTPVSTDNRDRGKWDDPAIQRRVTLKKSIELSMLVGSTAPYRHATNSPWPTPAARDVAGKSGAGRQKRKGNPSDTVPNAVATVPWETPTATDPKRGTKPPRPHDTGIPLTQQVSGLTQEKSTAETESIAPSQLNPRFSLWLMGYPIEWAYSGERVTPLSRKRQRKS